MMKRATLTKILSMSLPATALSLAACSGGDPAAPAMAAEGSGSGGWTHPVTPWGDPDLQGMWPIGHLAGNVPVQRPEEFGDRLYLSEEEMQQRQERLDAQRDSYEREIDSNRIGMGHWAESRLTAQVERQTSLIVEPANGRLPALTPAGEAKAATLGSTWQTSEFYTPDDFDNWDRCITRGLPPSMFPFHYNNGIQIIQAPGYVVVRLEMIHEARIVPLDGRPQLDDSIRQWLGDSRGYWEGNTLVIETTNFNGKGHMTNVGNTGSPREAYPTSESLRIVERITRISDDEAQYEITIEDPEMLVQPWKAAFPWYSEPGYQFFEYACHEGNELLITALGGTRAAEQRAREEAAAN
jgi:hypothetical protein